MKIAADALRRPRLRKRRDEHYLSMVIVGAVPVPAASQIGKAADAAHLLPGKLHAHPQFVEPRAALIHHQIAGVPDDFEDKDERDHALKDTQPPPLRVCQHHDSPAREINERAQAEQHKETVREPRVTRALSFRAFSHVHPASLRPYHTTPRPARQRAAQRQIFARLRAGRKTALPRRNLSYIASWGRRAHGQGLFE